MRGMKGIIDERYERYEGVIDERYERYERTRGMRGMKGSSMRGMRLILHCYPMLFPTVSLEKTPHYASITRFFNYLD